MGSVSCGECGKPIPDHSGCYEAELYPDIWNKDDGKCFEVYECQECGSLSIFYDKYGGSGFYVYTPKSGKNNEITLTSTDEFKCD
jgi:hypothetical protein